MVKKQNKKNLSKSQKREKLSVTYSDGSSSLQSELVGKLVGDGAAIAYLSLHLPVAQRLVLQERNEKRDGNLNLKFTSAVKMFNRLKRSYLRIHTLKSKVRAEC